MKVGSTSGEPIALSKVAPGPFLLNGQVCWLVGGPGEGDPIAYTQMGDQMVISWETVVQPLKLTVRTARSALEAIRDLIAATLDTEPHAGPTALAQAVVNGLGIKDWSEYDMTRWIEFGHTVEVR